MKLHTQTQEETLVIGGEQELNFSIDSQSGVIFDILRDKMYSNKIGSIVREIASNSRDANRESGRGDEAITIMITSNYSELLPDQECIIFKDLGPGITEQRVADVFVKYAASTKRYTNSQTGGFGLGAKTPFAYTDSFYIHTVAPFTDELGITKNKSYFYNALIDSSGIGKMVLLETDETDEATGTSIIIPLNSKEDVRQFAKEVTFYTSLWDNVEYINILQNSSESFDKKDIQYDCDTFMVVRPSYTWNFPYKEGLYALVDGIPYPVTRNNNQLLQELSKHLNNYTIFLKFNIGEVSVSATREAIEFNERTNQAIERVLNRSISDITKSFQNKLDSLTYLNGIKVIIGMFDTQQRMFQDNHPMKNHWTTPLVSTIYKEIPSQKIGLKLKFKGEAVSDIANRSKELRKNTKANDFEIYSVDSSRPSEYKRLDDTNLLLYSNMPIYYMDCRKDSRRNLSIFDTERNFLLLKPVGSELTGQQSDFLFDCVNKFELEPKFYSDVEKKDVPSELKATSEIHPYVSVRYRVIDRRQCTERTGYPSIVEVDRKTGDFDSFGEDVYFILVDSLGGVDCGYSMRKDISKLNTKFVYLSYKTYELYFKGKLDENKVYEQSRLHNLFRLIEKRIYDYSTEGVDKDKVEKLKEVVKNFGTSSITLYDYNSYNLSHVILLSAIDNKMRVIYKRITGFEPVVEDAIFYKKHEYLITSIVKDYSSKKFNKVRRYVEDYIRKIKKDNPLYYMTVMNGNIVDAFKEQDEKTVNTYIKQIRNLKIK